MDKNKKLRTPLRAGLTKAISTFEALIADMSNIQKEDLQAAMDSIERKAEQIISLDKIITETMVEENVSEEELQAEFDRISEYEEKLFTCRRKLEAILNSFYKPAKSEDNDDSENDSIITKKKKEKKYKLPKIEFTKYGGEIKDWLAFWAQFQKIHTDEDMPDEDKFHYLRQSTEEKSKAREIVDSFPMTAENYGKVVAHLISRFGNKDTLVEVYVRELLKLVMANALNPSKKIVLASLYDKMETQLRALESLEVTRDEFVAILYPLVESCLPEEILRAWERYRIFSTNKLIDKLSQLMLFLKGEVESEERISLARDGFSEQVKKSSKKEDNSNETPTAAGLLVKFSPSQEKNWKICIFCKKSHYSNQCIYAKKLTLLDRQKICEEERACFICLMKGHMAKDCLNKSKIKCQDCGGHHNQLMCRNTSSENKIKTSNTLSVSSTATSNMLIVKKEETVLSTLLVRVRNGDKTKIIRAAFDSGAHKTYMLKKLIVELGFVNNGQEKLLHELFGGHQIKETTHNRYTIQVENLNGLYNCKFDVLEQEKICYNVDRIKKGEWLEKLHDKNVTLSDVGDGSSEIEMLIGNDIAGKLLIDILRLEEYENFVAMNYSIGWTIMGKIPIKEKSNKILLVHTLLVKEANLEDLWRLDLIGIEDTAETKKKEMCMETTTDEFMKTLQVNQEGRFEISLPFRKGCPPIKSNKSIAEQRLMSMTRKLSPELKNVYQKIFDEWQVDGIIEEVPQDQLGNFGHYLPHKPVLNPNSSTTPVRPVFDASAKQINSLSLNDCLIKGPNLLEVVTSIMTRFRLWRFGELSDIKKAFLQISINPDSRNYLRFLWWEKNSSERMKIYRHRRLVFGLTCSSFVLAALINEILETAAPDYIETAKQLKNANYVDNCVTSVKDEITVKKFMNEATKLLSTKRFELRGWEWNAPNSDPKKEIFVLGLKWNLAKDSLTCDINKGDNIEDEPITKQKILSITHQIFDPIGFTTPLVILPKILLQKCWILKIGWKVPVPEEISMKFRNWCRQLSMVKSISVPRWIGLTALNMKKATIHIFADASKVAYTACVFIRIEEEGEVTVQLVQCKTRIAPLKNLSINRLELLGCLIAARLSSNVVKDMDLGDIECIYWTDSANALHWITHEDQWGIYVWNRVEEIKKLTKVQSWRHIPGNKNPADLPSRGCTAKQLIESSWWEGPKWLKETEENWPKSTTTPDEDIVNSERKKIVICNWEQSRTRIGTSWMTNLRIDYGQMIRFVTIMKRLIKNRKLPAKDQIRGKLLASELTDTESYIIRTVQNEAFTSNDPVLNNMELLQDEHGVLRIKTRIIRRADNDSFKIPAILPNKHPVVRAIIEYYHRENAHASILTLMALLREKFWIHKSRVAVKKVVRECFICRWFSAKPFVTEPAQLPLDRIRDAALFEVTGVDLTGHLFLQDGSKAWIVLYTCAIYRVVKLDLVTSLTTDAFVRSLRRFIATEGRPKIIYSDNGTNLKGTDNSLKDVNWKQIHQTAATEKIDWRFIPSKAPWWGGWWERLIGVVKNVLKRVLGKSSIEYDEMRTIIYEVAAVVNSRPLTYMTEDPTELQALSPSMFLNDLIEYGTPDLDSVNAKKLNERQQQRLQLKKELRERFRSEYLSQLVQKNNQKASRPIEVGELILMKNENQKRTLWPLAKVIEVFPSSDGVIRVAKIKTIKGEIQRPVKELIPLEIRQGESISTFGLSNTQMNEITALETPEVTQTKGKAQKKKSKKETKKVEIIQDPKPIQYSGRGRLIKKVDRFTN